MKPGIKDIHEKQARKKLAHVQLKASAAHAKQRFAPGNLVMEGKEKAEQVTDVIVDESIDLAKKHKWPLAGVAAAIGLLLARKPIQDAVSKIRKAE
ncbi:hypothetical protein [Sphingorhabdus sp. Alg239-R122]|uniref:hypothetical protein n=1 Tax=Sphingorhabdus sp. Alg239-R122 TaxID=2305989 RepID=UPI0013D95ABF|nr:hypothetical protein [Sphingorhabdus sp. Alg239-R122]